METPLIAVVEEVAVAVAAAAAAVAVAIEGVVV